MKSKDTPDQNKPLCTGVIIPAAGFGTRMKSRLPKQFLTLGGQPVLIRTVTAFLEHSQIQHIVVVLPEGHMNSAHDLFTSFAADYRQRLTLVAGGDTRQQSVYNGLQALPTKTTTVLVHDGARPLVSKEVIDRCIEGVLLHRAVIAAVPVKDTLKKVDGTYVQNTVNREKLWQAQTPQAMEYSLLHKAYTHAFATNFAGTDEASLLEHAAIEVHVVEGSEKNIKITRPADLTLANSILNPQPTTMKIGHGFDAHCLVTDRKLILGGQEIPFHLGLAGHSDADVLTHALIDAILGAMGEGDIGRHFPDSDATYRGANSLHLLEHVMQLAETNNYMLGNADLTIVCQRPRLAPYLTAMKTSLAAACKAEPNAINIKATTTEKMGFTGRGEGISAHAVVLLKPQTH